MGEAEERVGRGSVCISHVIISFMNSSDRSLFSRVSSWLRGGSASSRSQELERLRSEQIRLSTELEALLSSYDEQTRALASSFIDLNHEVSEQDLQGYVDGQQKLWRVVRRLQAAERTVPQLEQEYREWHGRNGEGLSRSHPDHPETRLELIASELRARGRAVPAVVARSPYEGSAKDANPFEALDLDDNAQNQADLDESINDSSLDGIGNIPVSDEMTNQILESIRECGLQIRRQSSRSEIDPRDLAELYRELRHHHAQLRGLDRRSGSKRYRVVLHE